MLKSMTGFGKSSCNVNNKRISVELKSINSKSFDLSLKLPAVYKDKDLELRTALSGGIERGKIDCLVQIESTLNEQQLTINKPLFFQYAAELQAIAKNIGEENVAVLPIVAKFHDVYIAKEEQVDETEKEALFVCLQQAITSLNDTRLKEGAALKDDFLKRIHIITNLLQQVYTFEPERIKSIRERFIKNMEALKDTVQIDPVRLEQEIFFYLEKLDITEECVRLKQHCSYFIETMEESSAGKKLGFIAQEIGREINTIGSKANNVHIQKIVVEMKDELEKIKEQLANIL